MKIKKWMFVIIVAIIICFIINLILINYIGYRMFPISNKVTIGDSKDVLLDYPWGNATNLTIFADFENISAKDKENYNDSLLVAKEWWANDITHNLSYSINFKVINSKEANIIINWNKTLFGGRTIRGHTYINSTNESGDKTCDTYNPPYTRCNITVLTNLSYETNLFVIKHELGHALGLKHSFDLIDFFMAYTTYFGTDPVYSEIMFDFEVFNQTKNSLFNFYKNFKWKQK